MIAVGSPLSNGGTRHKIPRLVYFESEGIGVGDRLNR
jgi:hypothetical protein